jgi:hypothetical protein
LLFCQILCQARDDIIFYFSNFCIKIDSITYLI